MVAAGRLSAEGPVRLSRELGTARFCTAPDAALLGWSADGSVLYLTREHQWTFRVWRMDARGGALLSVSELDAEYVSGAVPAGPSRALVDSAGARPNHLGLWDLDRAALVGEVRARDAATTTLALPSQGQRSDSQACVPDPRCSTSDEPLDGLRPGAASADGTMFLRGEYDGPAPRVAVYGADGARIWTLKSARNDPPRLAAFALDGGVVVASALGSLGCWDLDRRSWRWRESRHRGAVIALLRSHDGRSFYTYGEDGRLCATSAAGEPRWETALHRRRPAKGRLQREGARVVASPDGSLLAVSLRGSVRVVDAATGADRTALDGHAGAVTCLAFSRDGSLVASGGADGDVRVYDAPAGDERWLLENDGAEVTGAAFRDDRASVLVYDRSGEASEWSLRTGLEVSRATEGECRFGDLAAATDGDRVLVLRERRRRLWVDRSPERTAWSYEAPGREGDDGQERYWARPAGGRDGFSGDGARALITAPVTDDRGQDASRLVTLDVETGAPVGGPRTLPGTVLDVVHGVHPRRALGVAAHRILRRTPRLRDADAETARARGAQGRSASSPQAAARSRETASVCDSSARRSPAIRPIPD